MLSLKLSYLLCFFSSIPFFLTSVLCRSCLVNHIDLERLFCLEDFLTWDHGQLIWFVLELFCMYLFTSACYLYSDAPNRFASLFQALSVGIFPYVLKLLQTSAMELRQILVFIWTKILSLDKVCTLVWSSFVLEGSGV